MTGTLPEFGGQESLYFVSCAWNNVGGPLPSSLFELPNLKMLYLMDAEYTGTIPTEFGSLSSSLEVLTIRNNGFHGTVPTELGSLTRLSNLELASNELTGTIPTELENLTRLKYLRIQENKLNGEIPVGMAKSMPQLGKCNLSPSFSHASLSCVV